LTNTYVVNFERLLIMYITIDKRKNNWIITIRTHLNISKNVIIGLLDNNSWNSYKDMINLIYYRFLSTKYRFY